MNRQRRPQRRGNVVVLSAFLMMVLMAMVAFAVDIGYIAEAHTQLQRSADACALAAACKLPSLAQATLAATSCANDNKTNVTPALKATDIVFGWWDRDTATFITPKPVGRPTNAVKITLRRTAANGNPLGLFFGRVMGRNTTDVIETAIGYGDRGVCGPFIGIQGVTTSGDLTTNSYDSFDGSYDPATAGNQGSLCSDGSITVGGSAYIDGDVRAGEGQTTTINGGTLDITGQLGNRETQLNLPSVDASPYAILNDNLLLPKYKPPMSGWIDPINGATGDFKLEGGAVYDIPPGTYYFNSMTLVGGSVLNISGKTVIYVTGSVDFHGGSQVNNNTELANNLWINVTGPENVNINSSTTFYGVVYAPDSDVHYAGSADYFGAIVGKTLAISGNAIAHYDESLDVPLGAYALRVMLVD